MELETPENFKVLIVDDEDMIRTLLSRILRMHFNVSITDTSSVITGASIVSKNEFDLVFLDHCLPDGVGWSLAKQVRTRNLITGAGTVIVAMSGTISPTQLELTQSGIDFFVKKPFDLSEVVEVARAALSVRRVP